VTIAGWRQAGFLSRRKRGGYSCRCSCSSWARAAIPVIFVSAG